ncbi:hypothetical protein BH11BAC5_BH11BAC5_34530 [soil metagenome]
MAHNINFNEEKQQHSFFSNGYVKLYIIATGYFQNVRTYKNEEAKLKSLLFGGTGQLRTQKAFQLCERFAKAEIMEFYN